MLSIKRSVRVFAVLTALVVATALPSAAAPRADADWSEAYFPSSDGINTLHADILRPKGMPLDADHKTPVIMTVSPYLNHGGVPTNDPALGHVNGQGPSERFYDFLNLSNAIQQGYTYVMVDLPGFGGSSGCNDWGGNREQIAVKDAVEWAAEQPWSNGKIGLMGKSYDAWTGLMGVSQQPKGLAAVVAMEPVYSGYRYLYNNGVRFTNSVLTPALFQAIDAQPGTINDTPQYLATGAPQAWCYGVNLGLQQQDDANSPFWLERDLLISVVGEKTPVFLTQGFLERNTKPDGAFDYWNALAGKKNRAWFGQFDHDRGWDKSGNRFNTGREVFVQEMMRFFDQHLKGIEVPPGQQDPTVAVQDNLGRYRAEDAWPPRDVAMYWSNLNTGSYTDDGLGNTNAHHGALSVSQAVPHDVWMAGEPVVKVRVDSPLPRTNVTANVFDIAPDGRTTHISRGTYLLRGVGEQVMSFDLYGQDWLIREGHRIGVRVTDANAEWWVHAPTGSPVTIKAASIGLPFLHQRRMKFLDGGSTPRLESHLGSAFTTSAATIGAAERAFDLPPPLGNSPAN